MLTDDKFISEKTGFKSIERIGRFVLILIQRCWRACSAAILFLLLLYWMYGGVVIFLLLTTALIGAFYHYQDALLFFPDQPESSRVFVQSPHKLGLPYENLQIKTKDGIQINVVFLKQAGQRLATAPTVVFFHGNAGNIGHRLLNAHVIYTYSGCNVLLVEYRGYGKSEGSPSEEGLQLDAESAMDFLLNRQDIDHSKIVIYGRSLGGAVAIGIAANPDYMDNILAVIVENTFTSIPAIARHMFSWINKLPLVCYRNRFPSLEKIKTTSIPTLFISGLADQMIPPAMMAQLHNASAASFKKLEPFETGTHNDTWQCYGYTEAINRFLNEVLEARAAGLIPQRPRRANTVNDCEGVRVGVPKDI